MIRKGNRFYSECFGKGYFLKVNGDNIKICYQNDKGDVEELQGWDKSTAIQEYYEKELKVRGNYIRTNGKNIITLHKNLSDNEIVSRIPEISVLEDLFRGEIFKWHQIENKIY